MPTRRRVLSTLALSVLFTGCGGSEETTTAKPVADTPEQTAAREKLKNDMMNGMKKGRK